MISKKQLDLTDHKIWKDRDINPEAKVIYCYLYVEGFDKEIAHISIGKVQTKIKHIRNIAFRKNMKLLEKYNYIKFIEYANGLYEYHIC